MIQKYIVTLSNKATIAIDEDEVALVIQAIKTGQVGRVRQGVFNPSYFVSLTVDEERHKRYLDDNRYKGEGQRLNNRELLPLADIFTKVLPPASAPKKIK